MKERRLFIQQRQFKALNPKQIQIPKLKAQNVLYLEHLDFVLV